MMCRTAALFAAVMLSGCGTAAPGSGTAAPGSGTAAPGSGGAARAAACDLVAAPDGSDAARGTVRTPLRTPQRLADALRPGQTGCLRAGSYPGRGREGYVLRFGHGGRSGARITVRGYPGERARLAGVVYVPRGADSVTLSQLDVDDPTPFARQITIQVNARDTVLDSLDVTNDARKNCVILGSLGRYGPAVHTIVRDSVLHRCGDPANHLRDHAIYVSNASRTRITGNLIWGAGGFAVQLYPRARGTVVRGNVIADNGGGVIFGGEGAYASSGNVVERNVIAGSAGDFNLASYWPARVGTGNAARDNCLLAGSGGDVDPDGGFAVDGNAFGDPSFADGGAHDYRLIRVTPCSRLVGTGIAALALSRAPVRSAR